MYLIYRLHVYIQGHFPQVYEPTVFENHVQELVIDDQIVEIAFWDTAGQEDFDRLRSLSYADTHVIMLCFSVDQPSSLANAESKWLDEIIEHCPGVKICLVALKCDLRDDFKVQNELSRQGLRPVEYEEGLATARRIRASRYLECSAKHNRGVREAFLEVAKVSINSKSTGFTRNSFKEKFNSQHKSSTGTEQHQNNCLIS
ncbi:ras family-domain-containing protein [Phakopsora pachyrhizi]|nr:ras family-domain-containing protein [Phakopsora pachyrhizi]